MRTPGSKGAKQAGYNQSMKDKIKLSALVTCPACGFVQPVEMPVDV